MISYAIIGITLLVSFLAFNNEALKERLIFSPYNVKRTREYERIITSGFIHKDITHLGFNMFVFWNFGPYIEQVFSVWFGNLGNIFFILLYFGALIFSSIPSWLRHQDNAYYKALGASGAVAAVLFSFILIEPLHSINVFFIPIDIPAVIIGILYLLYEFYADAKFNDNIGHAAHYFGAIFGFTLPVIFNYKLIFSFFDKIMNVFV